MNSYHEIDTIKIEKQKAMQRYRTFRKIANIVRVFEIIVAITLISYSFSITSSYFPAIVEFSGAFVRRISSLLFSPHFVFLIGNVIIITLFAKSSGENISSENSGDEIFGAKNSSQNAGDEIEIIISGERNIADNATKISGETNSSDNVTEISVEAENVAVVSPAAERRSEEKIYRRTKSAVETPVVKGEFRRSATVVHRKSGSGEKSPTMTRRFEVDELSNEEFQRKVEEFIEKQQRFLRKEKLAVVLSN